MDASATPSTYQESLDWLYGTQAFGIKLGLENIARLLTELGLAKPDGGAAFPHVLHVAGTNGKGSTCAFAESLCRASGLRTGLFTSPHLIRANERIRINYVPVTDAEFVGVAKAVHSVTSHWDPHPTFFELVLAMAMLHFRNAKVDVVILETGMGGRLDATSAVTPTASAITRIGLDHTHWLGDTIPEIAGEKAGIIKAGVPVVTTAQDDDAINVIRSRAKELGADCEIIGPLDDTDPLTDLGIPGAHQLENAALAAALVARSGISLSDLVVRSAFRSASWPARFHVVELPGRKHPLVIDGAHNPAAAEVLATTWKARFGNQLAATLLFAGLGKKDTAGTYQAIAGLASATILTETGSARAIPVAELSELLSLSVDGRVVRSEPSAALALSAALSDDRGPVLVAGSLFLAGIVLAEIEAKDLSDYQSSLQ